MEKKTIIRAAILAALILLAVILGIMAFSWQTDKETVIEIAVHTATPELVVLQTAEPTASPMPILTPAPAPTEEAKSTPAPTKKPVSTAKNDYAFTLIIEDRKINIAYGVDEATLDKTPGWLTTSASPGTNGMCVIYGHRNRNHLRVLEKVKVDDEISVTMQDGTIYTYLVCDITIYENTADFNLPTIDGKTLVLATCYPFRYSGNAPGKIVVYAKIV